jgi:NADH-quinone oxidoreductase subunit C
MSILDNTLTSLAGLLGGQAVAAVDRAGAGYHLQAEVPPAKLEGAAALLTAQGFFLEFVTAVDRVENLELVYMFGRAGEPCRVKLWLLAPKGEPVPSLANLIPAADWHERETFDMLGQVFAGHPDHRRILLPEDADFHPLLRDFKAVPGLAEA